MCLSVDIEMPILKFVNKQQLYGGNSTSRFEAALHGIGSKTRSIQVHPGGGMIMGPQNEDRVDLQLLTSQHCRPDKSNFHYICLAIIVCSAA